MFARPFSLASLVLGVSLMLGAFLAGALVPHDLSADPDTPRTVEFRKAKPDGSPVDRPYTKER